MTAIAAIPTKTLFSFINTSSLTWILENGTLYIPTIFGMELRFRELGSVFLARWHGA